jgi:hypothetical protein
MKDIYLERIGEYLYKPVHPEVMDALIDKFSFFIIEFNNENRHYLIVVEPCPDYMKEEVKEKIITEFKAYIQYIF